MFYSHTFLARKGPLGTVWCAAHLQHKLKKSHYTSTNIFSTVERIMHPEVPIALRMSGHLLLGIVRIYSKQVEYLYQDCNGALIVFRKGFSIVKEPDSDTNERDPNQHDPNEPDINERETNERDTNERDTNEPSVPVSKPEVYALDKVVVDYNSHRPEDDHVKNPEDITLPDQFPSVTGIHNVVTIVMEDVRDVSSVPEDVSESGPMPMEQDSTPLVPEGVTGNLGDHSTNNQAELNDLPELEIMRDAVHDTLPEYNSVFADFNDDRMEPDGFLEEQIIKSREASPILKELHVSGGPSRSNDPPEMLASEDSALPSLHGSPDLAIRSTPLVRKSPELGLRHTPLERGSVEMALQPAPPIAQQGVRVRKRRRQFYDEATALTNRVMKGSLDDTSNLLRAKRIRHIDNFGVWKQQNRLKKDAVFSEPVITGLSTPLLSLYKPQLIYSKNRLVSSREAQHEVGIAECPVSGVNDDMEIEHPRNFEGPNFDNPMSEILPSPQQSRSHSNMTMPSPSRRDEYTPATMDMNFTSQSDHLGETTRTEILSTPELTASTAFKYPDAETSTACLREGRGGQNTPLSDIPELVNSLGHLDFLEHDDNPPAGTPASVRVGEKEVPQFDTLPATTRAVGQYFKRQSSGTPSSEYSSESVSLDSILESKTRKICARMFFETLVLKSYGFVDVQQEEPYSAIRLKVTSKLKEQCSG